MTAVSVMPAHYDIDYILTKIKDAGVMQHYGYAKDESGITLRYEPKDFNAVSLIIEGYQTNYADEILRPEMLKTAADLRWDKQQITTFNGAPLPCDQTTINLVDATRNSMVDAPESDQTCLWKAGPTTWITLDAPSLLQMGLAIRNHVQACFNREKALQDLILAATTVDELILIDIRIGWPE